MNENEKNEPIGESAEGQDTQPSNDDIKAFKWDWAESGSSNEGEPTVQAEDAPEQEAQAEGEEPEEEQTEKAAGEEPVEITAEAEIEQGPRSSRPLVIASVLSACSIVLLLVFALSLMLGIFPINGKEVVALGVSTDGATGVGETASPDIIEDFLNSVVTVRTATSSGTGVIISEDGYIVTNYHVIEGTEIVTVQLYGEQMAVRAEVIGYHEDDDVAVVKIGRSGLRAAVFADSNEVRYGETVYAIGNPEGVEFDWSVTQGIISAPLRQLMVYDSDGILESKINVVQTDAAVNHGNSGGALINSRGELVGIVALKRIWSSQLDSSGSREPVEGMGFALPAAGVLVDVAAIIENGNADNVDSGITMPRPLIGITGVGVEGKTYYKNLDGGRIQALTDDELKEDPRYDFYAAVTGVYVSATSAGSDAAKYLKVGDIITEVNGNIVDHIYDVMDIVNKFDGGDKIVVKYYRNGKYYTAELTLRTAAELGQ